MAIQSIVTNFKTNNFDSPFLVKSLSCFVVSDVVVCLFAFVRAPSYMECLCCSELAQMALERNTSLSNYNRAIDVCVAVCACVWQQTPRTADVTVTKIAGYDRVRILMNR